MNERQLIVDWLRGRGDLYPKDVFPDQQPSGPLQVVRADAWSAQVARKFCDVWASQIEAGDHLNSGETLISNKRNEQMNEDNKNSQLPDTQLQLPDTELPEEFIGSDEYYNPNKLPLLIQELDYHLNKASNAASAISDTLGKHCFLESMREYVSANVEEGLSSAIHHSWVLMRDAELLTRLVLDESAR